MRQQETNLERDRGVILILLLAFPSRGCCCLAGFGTVGKTNHVIVLIGTVRLQCIRGFSVWDTLFPALQ
jgi:hypothetical protein